MIALVAYSSRGGSVEPLARAIAAELRGRGCFVDLTPLDALPTLPPYDVVVLGSLLADGAWLPNAASFLVEHAEALQAVPLWLFGASPAADASAVPASLRSLCRRLAPRDCVRLRCAAATPSRSQPALLPRQPQDPQLSASRWASSIADALQLEPTPPGLPG